MGSGQSALMLSSWETKAGIGAYGSFMVALWNRETIYIFMLFLLLSSSLWSAYGIGQTIILSSCFFLSSSSSSFFFFLA